MVTAESKRKIWVVRETWEVVSKSADYKKDDSHTIKFPVAVSPDKEKTITYTAHHTG
jgi:hypothetical protein